MTKLNPFSYFVGINSLDQIATSKSKVCVMNILGNESKKVTPISHTFSGANVVAGVQYGQKGKLETEAGDIPVYTRLAEVVENHKFDAGVIYLPPEAVYYSVTELCHYNKELKKIIIITEKISVKDQRLIRAVCQSNNIDVFGANCLGVADSWNRIRIGGALGGDRPEETLVKGSVAIHSNSGNFSTTIAEYLKTEGFGTTTIVSSGKDVIIHYSVPEFLFAAENDPRTKAVALYVEPGGYYEQQALDLIKNGDLKFTKPIIVCVTGRWKSNLTRACGHAGALAGEGDDALSKEKLFDKYFGVPAFDPNNPTAVGEKGVRVTSIQHIPQAMKAIYKKLDQNTDFQAKGNLGLKSWFGNDFGLNLPLDLRMPVVEGIPPYNKEIETVNKQLGASYMRQNMRNASGASRINPTTQVAELHGKPIVELTDFPLESNMIFALTKSHPDPKELRLVNICLNYLAAVDDSYFSIVEKAKKNNATPNETWTTVVSLMGDNQQFILGRKYMNVFFDVFSEIGVRDVYTDINIEKAFKLSERSFKKGQTKQTLFTDFIIKNINNLSISSCILNFASKLLYSYSVEDPELFLVSAALFHFVYPSLVLKKVSRDTVENMGAFLSIETRLTLLSAIQPKSNELINKIRTRSDLELLTTSFTEVAYQAIFNETPDSSRLREFSSLIALTLTNGPGTISAKGAKESVSARNHITTSYAGFLNNTGFSHGGSGYEAIEFLLNSLKDQNITDPNNLDEIKNLKSVAIKIASDYLEYKNDAKLKGILNYKRIPCINHPVFKGNRVNIDPREDFIRKKFEQEGIQNIFWDFYHHLVDALYEAGVTQNVYCVNIDAVIAVISLKLMWDAFKANRIEEKNMQDIGFLIFLVGRAVGVSAEIADHRNRGNDMDCRTPVSETRYVV